QFEWQPVDVVNRDSGRCITVTLMPLVDDAGVRMDRWGRQDVAAGAAYFCVVKFAWWDIGDFTLFTEKVVVPPALLSSRLDRPNWDTSICELVAVEGEAISRLTVYNEEVVAGASGHDGKVAASLEREKQLGGMQANVLELSPRPAALLRERNGEHVESHLVELDCVILGRRCGEGKLGLGGAVGSYF